MHNCKVKSHSPVFVQAEEYNRYKNIVSNEAFFTAIEKAQDEIMRKHHDWEIRKFQNEFSLPLSRNIFGLYTIPVYINHIKATFVVDTGAQISGIKKDRIHHFQLRKAPGKLTVGSIGGKNKTLDGFIADAFQMGVIEISNMGLVSLDSKEFSLRFGNIDLFRFDGIIGWDILHQLDFEIDDIEKKFKVIQNRFRIPHPNMIKGSFPCLLTKKANGDIVLFGLDTGSRISWIGEESISKHQLSVIQEGSALGMGVHGVEKLNIKVIKEWKLYLDKAEINLQNTITGRVDLFEGFRFDGVFGNDIFHRRRIRVINSAGMVLLA